MGWPNLNWAWFVRIQSTRLLVRILGVCIPFVSQLVKLHSYSYLSTSISNVSSSVSVVSLVRENIDDNYNLNAPKIQKISKIISGLLGGFLSLFGIFYVFHIFKHVNKTMLVRLPSFCSCQVLNMCIVRQE